MQQRHPDMLTDGWKWKVRGSAKLPAKRPLYRRSLYYYDSRDGVEKDFQKKVFERLDNGYAAVSVNYLHTHSFEICLKIYG